ncbi:N-formylglutamate amidohydrolase [Yunchengibacter salinarum]|uniref:N-formylglutamate amidohydrolase n=1 Tax=Yunchengibacter salinarum TaxID=3133399 RepID=UPI0035B5AF61
MPSTDPPPFLEFGPAALHGGRETRSGCEVVFAVPHSGRHYPAGFVDASPQTLDHMRQGEDAYVDHLIRGRLMAGQGGAVLPERAHILVATHGRAYLDLNRARDELDPAMFQPSLPLSSVTPSDRVAAGLGVLPHRLAPGRPLYPGPLHPKEATRRLDALHRPYHARLTSLLDDAARRFGQAVMVDCHSMPSPRRTRRESKASRAASMRPPFRPVRLDDGPDIILGDRWGRSASSALMALMESCLRGEGLSVRRNHPYAGGYCTSYYGQPVAGRHAIQVEINRALYMNEDTCRKSAGFDPLCRALQRAFLAFLDEVPATLPSIPGMGQAAE